MLQLPIHPKISKYAIPFFIVLGILLFVLVQLLKSQGLADETDEFFIPAVGAMGLYVIYGFIVWMIVLRQPESRFLVSEDLSSLDSPSPIEGNELETVMEHLGFSLVGKFGRDGTVNTWIYLDKPSETMLLVNRSGVPQFHSIFQDGYLEVTDPNNYRHPMPPSTPILEQYTNAYSAHQNGIKTKLEKHGSVTSIEGVESWLNFEKENGYQQIRKNSLKQAVLWGSFSLMIISVWIVYMGQKLGLPPEIGSVLNALPLISFVPAAILQFMNMGEIIQKSPSYSGKSKEVT